MQENKLYVGGFPYSVTKEELTKLFSEAGEITNVIIVTDKMTRRSKGFGFVEMSTEEAAQKAISMFNGKDFQGRTLTVNIAKPMEKKEFGGGNRYDRPRRNF